MLQGGSRQLQVGHFILNIARSTVVASVIVGARKSQDSAAAFTVKDVSMSHLKYLKDVSVRISVAPEIMEDGILSHELSLKMLENLHAEYGKVIEELKKSNVVTFHQRRKAP